MLNSSRPQKVFTVHEIAVLIEALSQKIAILQEEIRALRQVESSEFYRKGRGSKKYQFVYNGDNEDQVKITKLPSRNGRTGQSIGAAVPKERDWGLQEWEEFLATTDNSWWPIFRQERLSMTERNRSKAPTNRNGALMAEKDEVSWVRTNDNQRLKQPHIVKLHSSSPSKRENISKRKILRKRISRGVQCENPFWLTNHQIVLNCSQPQSSTNKELSNETSNNMKHDIYSQIQRKPRAVTIRESKLVTATSETSFTNYEETNDKRRGRRPQRDLIISKDTNSYDDANNLIDGEGNNVAESKNIKNKIVFGKEKKSDKTKEISTEKKEKTKFKNIFTQTKNNESSENVVQDKKKSEEIFEEKQNNTKIEGTSLMTENIKINKSLNVNDKQIVKNNSSSRNSNNNNNNRKCSADEKILNNNIHSKTQNLSMKQKLNKIIRKASNLL